MHISAQAHIVRRCSCRFCYWATLKSHLDFPLFSPIFIIFFIRILCYCYFQRRADSETCKPWRRPSPARPKTFDDAAPQTAMPPTMTQHFMPSHSFIWVLMSRCHWYFSIEGYSMPIDNFATSDIIHHVCLLRAYVPRGLIFDDDMAIILSFSNASVACLIAHSAFIGFWIALSSRASWWLMLRWCLMAAKIIKLLLGWLFSIPYWNFD